MQNRRFQKTKFLYFVEGQTESKLLSVLKTYYQCIMPGKVTVLNSLNQRITKERLRQINHKTNVVLLIDTDEQNRDLSIFYKNIETLKKCAHVKNVFIITQCTNLEEEIVYSTSVNELKELTGSRSSKNFKKDWINTSDDVLYTKLKNANFSINKLWSRQANGIYKDIKNNANDLKK